MTYPPQDPVSLGGGSTFFSNEGSAAYLHYHQYRDSEEAYYTSSLVHFPGDSALQYGPRINGYGIPYDGSLQPPGPKYNIPPNMTKMDTEATYTQLQGYAPTSALPDQSHQYTPVDIVPKFPISSTPIGIPSTLTTASPASSDDPESPETFPCPDPACSKRYAQSQGARRHFREKHAPNPCCFSSCSFKWGRPYHYKDHLTKKHGLGNVDIH